MRKHNIKLAEDCRGFMKFSKTMRSIASEKILISQFDKNWADGKK